jgi:peptide/nickel transport system permease protein
MVTATTTTDGKTLVSPRVEVTDNAVRIEDRDQVLEIERSAVVSLSRHRYWLGSDRFGRDVLRQLLRGGRVSLLIALLSAALAVAVGASVGVAAASGGRLVDGTLMRLVDALLAFPSLLLMILLAALLRPSPALLVLVLGLSSWMGVARLVRGQVLSLRTRTFVLAARTSGSRWHRILALHYGPGLAGPVSQDTALRLGDLVIAEATLSYLNLGVPATVPTWGSMVAEGHGALFMGAERFPVVLDGWWLATFPGLAIALLVVSLALVGDGVQALVQGSDLAEPAEDHTPDRG